MQFLSLIRLCILASISTTLRKSSARVQFMASIGKGATCRPRGNVPCPVTTVRALQVAHCRAASSAASVSLRSSTWTCANNRLSLWSICRKNWALIAFVFREIFTKLQRLPGGHLSGLGHELQVVTVEGWRERVESLCDFPFPFPFAYFLGAVTNGKYLLQSSLCFAWHWLS